MPELVRMHIEFNKFAGLMSLFGTVVGLVCGGATISSNVFIGAAFFLLAIVSFIIFVMFLYNFVRYAQYVMPYENVKDEMEKEEP